MRILIIKTSSMGDILHTLPALTDAGKNNPAIRFDWIVEENFADIPKWHPLVENVIPVAVRRWRKKLFAKETQSEINQFLKTLRSKKYDLVIDAQGLFKTIWIAWLAKGPLCGFDRHSAREPLTSLFYRRRYAALWKWHAVTRLRSLFSQALGYALPETVADYGIDRQRFVDSSEEKKYIVFLHGTTWPTKHWPEAYWIELANRVNENNLTVKLPWGNAEEQQRAQRIAANCSSAEVLPRLGLTEIAKVLAKATAVVAVDTGLGHLAAALNVPTVSVYGPTDAALTGTVGESQIHLSAVFPCSPCLNRICTYPGAEQSLVQPPCFATISPTKVFCSLKIP